MKKPLLIAAALMTLVVQGPVPALAQSSPPTISCGQARAMVATNGAAVVRSSRFIYDRYVTDVRFCARGQSTQAAFIDTTDNPYCPVGFTCIDQNIRQNRN